MSLSLAPMGTCPSEASARGAGLLAPIVARRGHAPPRRPDCPARYMGQGQDKLGGETRAQIVGKVQRCAQGSIWSAPVALAFGERPGLRTGGSFVLSSGLAAWESVGRSPGAPRPEQQIPPVIRSRQMPPADSVGEPSGLRQTVGSLRETRRRTKSKSCPAPDARLAGICDDPTPTRWCRSGRPRARGPGPRPSCRTRPSSC